ncbi:hypothetical protein JL102_18710 [Fulvivirga sp. 2943]|uniref:Uncharacterized protein n=2 Tax=Fulvivirga sediminis TaxID=2803949 RepID=A0A937F8C3_9BACT|nr:hypothetical protein [Fulvivirga sediminis]
MILQQKLKERHIVYLRIFIILAFSSLPLLINLPYRVNIFLTWEGAYRMYLGQIPFKDFGMPLGFGFWLIPAIFFKIFGPYMHTLIIAQAFLNVLSLLAISSIFKMLKMSEAKVFLSILVMCLTFVLINFWPWYNHTVFIFEIFAIFFIIRYTTTKDSFWQLIVAAFFTCLSIFTKQDGGGLALIIISVIVLYYSFINKRLDTPLIFFGAFAAWLLLFIVPFLQYDFSYWFNYGQSPHYSRINIFILLGDIFGESVWEKFFLLACLAAIFFRFNNIKEFIQNQTEVIFSLLTIGLLFQALIIQTTSFSPVTVNYYFTTFGVAYLLHSLPARYNFSQVGLFLFFCVFIFIWRSENYWKYGSGAIKKVLPKSWTELPEDAVAKGNWMAESDTVKVEPTIWQLSKYKSLKHIKLPQKTIEGLEETEKLDAFKKGDMKVLNMSNLTFLAYEWDYDLESGPNYPLWYHKDVALFDREVDMLCEKVANKQYDLIIFEDMPTVDSFFPYAVRECMMNNYKIDLTFPAPTGYGTDHVEVYTLK